MSHVDNNVVLNKRIDAPKELPVVDEWSLKSSEEFLHSFSGWLQDEGITTHLVNEMECGS